MTSVGGVFSTRPASCSRLGIFPATSACLGVPAHSSLFQWPSGEQFAPLLLVCSQWHFVGWCGEIYAHIHWRSFNTAVSINTKHATLCNSIVSHRRQQSRLERSVSLYPHILAMTELVETWERLRLSGARGVWAGDTSESPASSPTSSSVPREGVSDTMDSAVYETSWGMSSSSPMSSKVMASPSCTDVLRR
jgi:hypothetical protein